MQQIWQQKNEMLQSEKQIATKFASEMFNKSIN